MTSRTAIPADQRAYRAASVVRIERRLAILEAQYRKKVCAEQPSFKDLFSIQQFLLSKQPGPKDHRPKPARVLAQKSRGGTTKPQKLHCQEISIPHARRSSANT